MNDLRPPRRIGRSIAALLIGMAAGIALTIATDFVLHAIHVFPPWDQRVPDGLLALATTYRTVYSIAGSYLIARLAPYKPMQHALVAGAIGTVVSLAGAVATWNGGPGLRASLVSHCAGCAGIALRLGWCHDSREATTGVAGVMALYATSIAIRVTSSCRAIDGGGQRRTSASS